MAVGSGIQESALRHVQNIAEEMKCTCASSTKTESTKKYSVTYYIISEVFMRKLCSVYAQFMCF